MVCAFLIKFIWQRRVGKIYSKRFNIICRFHPTCSEYAVLCFENQGIYKGLINSVDRIKRCNPNNTDSCIDLPIGLD